MQSKGKPVHILISNRQRVNSLHIKEEKSVLKTQVFLQYTVPDGRRVKSLAIAEKSNDAGDGDRSKIRQ